VNTQSVTTITTQRRRRRRRSTRRMYSIDLVSVAVLTRISVQAQLLGSILV
jgi:hypothetical protein